jgi:hypothetical protein
MAIMTSTAVEEASALIASVAAGDELAFPSIVRLHHEDMPRVCVVVAGDDGIAALWQGVGCRRFRHRGSGFGQAV